MAGCGLQKVHGEALHVAQRNVAGQAVVGERLGADAHKSI